MKLTYELKEKYRHIRPAIETRLAEFAEVPEEKYFYELCFCICTPQSRAASALQVQHKLEAADFKKTYFDPTPILEDRSHYIRFHNQKAKRLIEMREKYPEIESVLISEKSAVEKRDYLKENVKGIGLKEAAHFLRNIGYRDLAILDRHILNNLLACGATDKVVVPTSAKVYLETEEKFKKLAENTGIPLDHLDLLFWYDKAGEIIK